MDVTKIKTIPAFVHFGTLDLGSTSSPIEFSIEGKYKDITADQFSDEILAKIVQGSDLKIKATFQEVDETLLEEIYGSAGLAEKYTGSCSVGNHTTEAACTGAGGEWTPKTPVIGFGSSKVGTNLASLTKALKVVPLAASESGKQLYFWKAYPTPGGLKYSGNDTNEVEIEFSIMEDQTKPKAYSKGILGDPTDYIS